MFFNKSGEEQVRSIFHNRLNSSIIIVSVTTKDECNSLKCRSVPIQSIEQAFTKQAKALAASRPDKNGKENGGQQHYSTSIFLEATRREAADLTLLKDKPLKGLKLFKDFCLRYPDFIEFDELNAKIITKHSLEDAYRVWSLATYQLQYVLKDDKIAEFKICHGVMLLLYVIEENCVPMALINVHTGRVLMKISFD